MNDETKNKLARFFPFVPIIIGFMEIIFKMVTTEPNTSSPIQILCISFLGAWFFCILALAYVRYKKASNTYYRKIFIGLAIFNLFTVPILVLLIPWTIIPVIIILLAGAYLLRNPEKPLRLF